MKTISNLVIPTNCFVSVTDLQQRFYIFLDCYQLKIVVALQMMNSTIEILLCFLIVLLLELMKTDIYLSSANVILITGLYVVGQ